MIKIRYERHKHHMSLKCAFNGIVYTLNSQSNFVIHLIFFIITMVASYIYNVSVIEVLIILTTSATVFVAETINTAIEALCDEVAKGKNKTLIGIAKDASAGAVLISAIFAIIVALIIFLPKVYEVFHEYYNTSSVREVLDD